MNSHPAAPGAVGRLSMAAHRFRAVAAGVAVAAGSFGCAVVTDVKRLPDPLLSCTGGEQSVCGLDNETEYTFQVSGVGQQPCESIGLTFGDSSKLFSGAHDFSSGPWEAKHRYGKHQWPGIKTVRAAGIGSCFGDVRLPVRVLLRVPRANDPNTFVFRSEFVLAFAQPPLPAGNTAACASLNEVMPIEKGSVVTIDSDTSPIFMVDYGCLFSGCVYDAAGEAGSSAPSSWPFPGLRKYSMVYRVGGAGGQVVQGGNSTRFTTTRSGELEFCLNDENMLDNSGGFRLSIKVDN